MNIKLKQEIERVRIREEHVSQQEQDGALEAVEAKRLKLEEQNRLKQMI